MYGIKYYIYSGLGTLKARGSKSMNESRYTSNLK